MGYTFGGVPSVTVCTDQNCCDVKRLRKPNWFILHWPSSPSMQRPLCLLEDAPLLGVHVDVPDWWCSKFLRTILAKILASIEAVVAAAAARNTLPAPTSCKRPAWCTACRPPGIVNCSISEYFSSDQMTRRYTKLQSEVFVVRIQVYGKERRHTTMSS